MRVALLSHDAPFEDRHLVMAERLSEVLALTVESFRSERVLFGSDFPLNLYPKLDEAPGLSRFVAEARSGGANAAVMGTNAARLFGWHV